MSTFKALHALALVSFGSLLFAACAVTPAEDEVDGDDATTSAAVVRAKKACLADTACVTGDVCDLYCPIIPGRFHCEIAGGTCEPRAMRTTASLHGETFTSSDGAHSITFAANGTFKKTDGCDPIPGHVTCDHIELTTGTYASSSTGKTVKLTTSLDTTDTLSVETHCYEGLHDPSSGAVLYPSP